ncbi:hypothetical protein DDZ13_11935 [Coraliomargarita sinensis]|uniref:Response regulatory domain-containing protein n=1 Tax=Coraliomargarita sinensis TaxID=2174842 RepID=A0A317ZI04_9BACT|nr:response regulator [Coraliomargarita sinensis]PXA03399.1 hypothetical protein DDZ13_11935 [Coraliomargarita sinensis]
MTIPTNASTSSAKDPKTLLKGKRVCILDDESAPIAILEANLAKFGLQTHSFNQPGPALTHLRTDRPDILLLDIMMPEMDGWEFYTTIRSEPELNDLPVLFVTCLADQELEREMEQDGLCATLSKPVFSDQLLEKLMQLLG